ncbi:FAD-dependent monooxygenase [Phenylobacterium deserti]|uniref:FAD-dependent oxidoreductase n=1 Tax=Phenylobacterium deserti TaxID=1914756 RepID=A0A328A9N7_9CAUL|nr:FAD-dependent monooxygenase [Phenylobacterium deserti]RAK51423.1 FAD-dependent oxidoreductase [Phenylobacterium deserti]
MSTQVLICGAGPTGLVLALWLTRQGVRVRIVDRLAEAGTTSRAVAVQARTLELYTQLGLTDAVVAGGHKTPGVNLWVRGERAARVGFEDVGEGLTLYSFLLTYPQDRHERLLIERLAQLGVEVEREVELAGFEASGARVQARLRRGDSEEVCDADFLVGCDGARSVVRKSLDAGFEGGTYRQLFYVADIEGDGAAMDGELHIDLEEADFMAVFPLGGNGRARLIGTVRDERADAETLRWEDVSQRAIENLKLQVRQVNWFSTYRVHHRVAERFRWGRVFLLGDAAHIHSPAGGQGMNTGLGDAINLAWKLAMVLGGRAPDSLLDSFDEERRAFARRLVSSTDRAFTAATAEGWIADLVRTRLAPLLVPRVLAIEPLREFAFRTVAQITLNYRGMALSAGEAGKVKGGDRLPWVRAANNYGPLRQIGWQAHVYGKASAELADTCARLGVRLHVFPWQAAHGEAGLAQDALYLLRPDTYVALADPKADPQALAGYLSSRGLRPAD